MLNPLGSINDERLASLVSRMGTLSGIFFCVLLAIVYLYPKFPLLGPLVGMTLLIGGLFMVFLGEEERRAPSPTTRDSMLPVSPIGILRTMKGLLHMLLGGMSILIGALLLVFSW